MFAQHDSLWRCGATRFTLASAGDPNCRRLLLRINSSVWHSLTRNVTESGNNESQEIPRDASMHGLRSAQAHLQSPHRLDPIDKGLHMAPSELRLQS